ncbi:hypothetical protein ACP70R_012453 [Stipagrostis hirtigluma subsp. patula]
MVESKLRAKWLIRGEFLGWGDGYPSLITQPYHQPNHQFGGR